MENRKSSTHIKISGVSRTALRGERESRNGTSTRRDSFSGCPGGPGSIGPQRNCPKHALPALYKPGHRRSKILAGDAKSEWHELRHPQRTPQSADPSKRGARIRPATQSSECKAAQRMTSAREL